MSAEAKIHLPDLTGPEPPDAPSPPERANGWAAIAVERAGAARLVAVPSLEDARAAAREGRGEEERCAAKVLWIDPPSGSTVVGFGLVDQFAGTTAPVSVRARVSPGLPSRWTPVLTIHPLEGAGSPIEVKGRAVGACRDLFVFDGAITKAISNGAYELTISAVGDDPLVLGDDPSEHVVPTVSYVGGSAQVRFDIGNSAPPQPARDRRAITLDPTTVATGVHLASPPATWPRPPLLAVGDDGCVIAAWSVNERGWALVPRGDEGVDVVTSPGGALVTSIDVGNVVRDAIFWRGAVAVLTAGSVLLYGLDGCAIGIHAPWNAAAVAKGEGLAPATLELIAAYNAAKGLPAAQWTSGLLNAVGLATTADGDLLVVQRGGSRNVVIVRWDGSLIRPPAFFERGYFARRRSAALTFDAAGCGYALSPSKVGGGCCVTPDRPLTDDEALFLQLVDDLPDLRRRLAYPMSGWLILGPLTTEDALDAGRPGTEWHRITLFGEIPEGCSIGVETRTSDDLLAGEPSVVGGWSRRVTASPESAVRVAAPGDDRVAAAQVLVLSGPGRYVWMRLTLEGDGASSPRITSIEVERPRDGSYRYLPKVYRDSTPEDDFLRRWLALFESTTWEGVAQRMNAYPELFDPRTAPAEMLRYLAGWLEIPVVGRLRGEPERLRRALIDAPRLAVTRGTLEGLALIVQHCMGITVRFRESFRLRSALILGAGITIDGVTGPVLGCDTMLTVEPAPTWLGDERRLGRTWLLECEERDGTVPWHFDVLVAERAICRGEERALLERLIEAERPAHTTWRLLPIAPAGFTVGLWSFVGQDVDDGVGAAERGSERFGIVLKNGPPRPKPIGEGFMLGRDARLAPAEGPPRLRDGVAVGRTTRVGE